MSEGRTPRAPWWFSGDDAVAEEAVPADAVAEEAVPDPSSKPGEEPAVAGMDWSLLMAGAQRMVDWATERVMAPHAEHDDPAEHPQCVVCRTIVVVGDPSGFAPPVDETPASEPASPPGEPAWRADEAGRTRPDAIRWIPIQESRPAP